MNMLSPIKAPSVIATTTVTVTARGMPRRRMRSVKGASTNASKVANARGISRSRPKYSAVTTTATASKR